MARTALPFVIALVAGLAQALSIAFPFTGQPLWWLLLWPLRFHEGPSDNLDGRIPGFLTESGFDPVSVADRWAGFVTFWVARKPAAASVEANSRK